MVSRGRESGAALVLALLVVAAMLTSVLLIAKLLQARQIAASYEQRSIVLTALSDAAVAESLAKLAEHGHFNGVPDRAFGGGRIRSTISTTPLGRKVVIATGEYGDWLSIARVEVHIDPETGAPTITKVRRTQVAR
jgi:hypothetical protein